MTEVLLTRRVLSITDFGSHISEINSFVGVNDVDRKSKVVAKPRFSLKILSIVIPLLNIKIVGEHRLKSSDLKGSYDSLI